MENASSKDSVPTFWKSGRKIKTKSHMNSEIGEVAVQEHDCGSGCSKRGETSNSGSYEQRKRGDTKVYD